MERSPPQHEEAANALRCLLYDLPSKLVAIEGRPGAGKTTLGRFLAWYFNISLIETDLFRKSSNGELTYRAADIRRLVDVRLDIPRPVIVEGAVVRRLLREIDRTPDFTIYIENENAPESHGALADDIRAYEAEFEPRRLADLILSMNH